MADLRSIALAVCRREKLDPLDPVTAYRVAGELASRYHVAEPERLLDSARDVVAKLAAEGKLEP